MSRVQLLTAVAVAVVAAVAPARGDGRYPETVSVTFQPGSRQDIFLGTSFGLLISHDDGASFYWVCEQNIGFNDGAFDPRYRVSADGTIYANTFDGLRISRDGGCSFETATAQAPAGDPGRIAGKWLDAVDVGPDGAVWVGSTDGGLTNEVYRSTDAGRTFAPLGLLSRTLWWKSLRVAPGDARRAYVTGYQVTETAPDGSTIQPTVRLFRTDDAGATWHDLPIGAFALGLSPLVLVEAVAPDDSALVFARSVRVVAPLGDKLYRSLDAGASWTEVLETTDTIQSVVVRPGGAVLVATVTGGVHRSSDRGATFVAMPHPPQARCLGDRGDALFACGQNWMPDMFALGRSADGESWTKVTRFVEMKAPVSCPAGTVQHDTCEVVRWPKMRQDFGLPDPTTPDAPGPGEAHHGGCACGGDAVGVGAVAAAIAVSGLLMRRRRRRCCD